jgi:hypothetical protein
MEWDDWMEQGGTIVGDAAGKYMDGPWGDIVGGAGDIAAGVGKVIPDKNGESNFGGVGDVAAGVMSMGKGGLELAGMGMSNGTGNAIGAIGGGLQTVSAIAEASQHNDDMNGSWWQNDYWGSMGDAHLGLAHTVLNATGNGAADKMLSGAELAVDALGSGVGLMAGEDYKFGAGDVMGGVQRATDMAALSPALNVFNPMNPLAIVNSVNAMRNADSVADIFVGQSTQDQVSDLYSYLVD